MSGLSLRDGFSVARRQARDRIESAMDLNKLFRVIDADPAIVGAGVVFIDSYFNVVTLREFQPICSVAVKRVITGGVSLVVSAVGVVAAAAGSLQCIINVSRVAGELLDPEGLDKIDSEAWYQTMSEILDGITLVGAALSFYSTTRYVMATKAATRKSYREILRGLSRQERLALTSEVHKYRRDVFGLPKRYSNAQIKQQTYTQLRDLVASGASMGGSLVAGHLKPIAVAVHGEF